MRTTSQRVYFTVRAIAFWLLPFWTWLFLGKWGAVFAAIQVLCFIALASAIKVIWKE